MSIASVEQLIMAALSGKIISFPTDTVPALAAKPDWAAQIFQAKKRGQDKPLILMAATAEALWPYVQGTSAELEIWQQVAQRYWPGPLTLVLPASPLVPVAMNPQNPDSIGIRVPNHEQACQILGQTGPLATTSANLSGKPPLTTIWEINQQFPEVLTLEPLKLENTISISGIPSTVAKWTDGGWEILRQGAIELEWR